MSVTSYDKFLRLQPLTGTLLIAAFVLLGYCPLRHTLGALIDSSHIKTVPVPDHGKITAAEDCGGITQVKVLAYTERPSHGPFPLMAAIILDAFSPTGSILGYINYNQLRITSHRQASIPIYLLNRVFRI